MKPKWFVAGIGAVLVLVGVVIGFAVSYSAESVTPMGNTMQTQCGSAFDPKLASLPACDAAINTWLPWVFIALGVVVLLGALVVKWDRTAPAHDEAPTEAGA